MIVIVVWSSATLAPTTNLDLSILTLTPTTFLGPLDVFTMSIDHILDTFLGGKLLEYLANELSNRLQRLELVVGLSDFLLLVAHFETAWVDVGVRFFRCYYYRSCLALIWAYSWMSFSRSDIF